jgi:hypothetical protein
MWAGIVLVALIAGDSAADSQPQGPPCPSPAEVDAELARVGAVGVTPPDLEVVGDRMRVVLHGRDGAPVGSREVEAPRTCHERATVAAVLVATWMGIWPESPKTASPSPSPSPPLSPASASAPSPPSAPSGAAGAELGLALLGAHDGNAAALGFAFEVGRPLLGPLRGWAGVTATTERERRVGPAVGGYLRPAVELGPALRLGRGRVQVDLALSARLGVLILRGKDLPVTYRKTRLAPGAAANLRLVLSGERLSPFVVIGGNAWLAPQELRLDDADATADLPRWEVTAGLGGFWAP